MGHFLIQVKWKLKKKIQNVIFFDISQILKGAWANYVDLKSEGGMLHKKL